jgi:hypothetical protein
MVDQLLALLGVKKVAMLIAGFLGSVMSLWFLTEIRTWPQRIFVVFGGALLAAFGTPFFSLVITMTETMERGLSFMVGLFGMTWANAIFIGIKNVKVGEIISGWLKRPGS